MTPSKRTRRDAQNWDLGTRGVILIGLLMNLGLLAGALLPTVWLVRAGAAWATTTPRWVLLLLGAVLVFNYGYLLGLLLLRIVIPVPKEGAYSVVGDKLPRQVLVFMFNVLLMKARYEPPWAAMFASGLSNIHPLRGLFLRFFGPHSKTTLLGDTCFLLDPHLLFVGRNVLLGFHCTITAHLFDNRKLIIRRVVIEDFAVIGGQAGIQPGVHIGHHAVVAGRSHVMAGTVIGPYEYWEGDPARKVKTLAPAEQREVAAAMRD